VKNFIKEIKDRKIRKWLAIYISTAITTIGVVHLLSIRYKLSDYIFDTVFFTLLFGIVGTAILAWFHGKEGKQKVRWIEIVIQSILAILLFITLYFTLDFEQAPKGKLDRKIVAVLPFANYNETNETEFFADGMTDDVLSQLSKISDLNVISRTSVMKYKNSEKSIAEISRELGAGTILEGSVRSSGNKIRIVGQLIDANNDVHMWSETYDRELNDIFEIQTDIAERIAAALQAKLSPLEKELIENKSTTNFDAYTFYTKGRHHYYNYTKEENETAIELFKKALEVDSNYALALAGLSDAMSQRVTKYWESDVYLDTALILAKKSVRKNYNLADGYKALGSVYQSRGEIDLAIANYKRAIELNPNYWSALLNYGQLKMFYGYYDEALYWIRRAHILSPGDIFGVLSVSMVYNHLNCLQTAIEWAHKAMDLEPKHTFANSFLGDLYLSAGDFTNAEKYFQSSVQIDSNWMFGWFVGARLETVLGNLEKAKEYFDIYMKITETSPEYYYAYVLSNLGELDSAKSILNSEIEDYTEYFETQSRHEIFNYMAFAEIYAINKDFNNAYKWWNKAINNGYTDIKRIKIYPYFNDLKNKPQYEILLNKMQVKIDSFKTEVKNNFPEYAECN
jgi:TolB-like protein